MSQPQLSLTTQRSPERAELARRISEFAAAEADLNFTEQSFREAQHRKFEAARTLDKLKEEAAEQGDADIASRVVEAIKAGKEIDPASLNSAAEDIARQIRI